MSWQWAMRERLRDKQKNETRNRQRIHTTTHKHPFIYIIEDKIITNGQLTERKQMVVPSPWTMCMKSMTGIPRQKIQFYWQLYRMIITINECKYTLLMKSNVRSFAALTLQKDWGIKITLHFGRCDQITIPNLLLWLKLLQILIFS